MKIIKQSHTIIFDPLYHSALRTCESAIRTCYKSEERMAEVTAEPLIRKIIKNGHHSCLEHIQFTFRLITNRGVTHELVRHRIGVAYSQESTRFVDYNGKEMEFIQPYWVSDQALQFCLRQHESFKRGESDFLTTPHDEHYPVYLWLTSLEKAENDYKLLRVKGVLPQFARGVLPNDLKTEIVMSANVRALRHLFELRVLGRTGQPHPDIKALLMPLYIWFREHYPVFFLDLEQ